MAEYWQKESDWQLNYDVLFELRASIALDLLKHWGLVAGKSDREDSSGRAICDLQNPEEAVTRAFNIAELFIQTAESKGYIKNIPLKVKAA